MAPFRNLISESLLIMEIIDHLASAGGSVSASVIVEHVMGIRNANEAFALTLVSDIVCRDPRLGLEGDSVLLNEPDHDSIDLSKASFVVFDLETTGAKAPPCRITEIGAYRITKGELAESFSSLVNPEMPIPEFITSLTGISDAMVSDAPRFEDIGGEFIDFIGDSILVAHNAPFDLGFLDHEIGRIYPEYRLGNPSLCTVQLSRRLLPNIENHKLNTVANYFSIDLVNHHRAGDDAKATARIFINLLDQMAELGIRDLGSARKFGQRKHHVKPSKAAA